MRRERLLVQKQFLPGHLSAHLVPTILPSLYTPAVLPLRRGIYFLVLELVLINRMFWKRQRASSKLENLSPVTRWVGHSQYRYWLRSGSPLPHVTGGQTKAWRSYLRPPNEQKAEAGFEPRMSGSWAYKLHFRDLCNV